MIKKAIKSFLHQNIHRIAVPFDRGWSKRELQILASITHVLIAAIVLSKVNGG